MNTCVICGAVIPEGRQICYKCEKSKHPRIIFKGVKKYEK